MQIFMGTFTLRAQTLIAINLENATYHTFFEKMVINMTEWLCGPILSTHLFFFVEYRLNFETADHLELFTFFHKI